MGRGISGGRGRHSICCHWGCHRRRNCDNDNEGMVLCLVSEICVVQWDKVGSRDLRNGIECVGGGAKSRFAGIERVIESLSVMMEGAKRSEGRRL